MLSEELKFGYIIRFRGNIAVTAADGEVRYRGILGGIWRTCARLARCRGHRRPISGGNRGLRARPRKICISLSAECSSNLAIRLVPIGLDWKLSIGSIRDGAVLRRAGFALRCSRSRACLGIGTIGSDCPGIRHVVFLFTASVGAMGVGPNRIEFGVFNFVNLAN